MHVEVYLSNVLKEFRTRNELSLDAMAEKSGVSRSLIYQIEKRTSVPTVTMLQKLADAMGMGLSDLIAPLDGGKSVRKGNRRELTPHISKDGSFTSYPIHALLENGDYEFFQFRFKKKGEHRAIRAQGVCVCLLVDSGELEIEESGTALALSEGDVAEFYPNRFYTYRQKSARLSSGTVIITKI